MWSKEAGSYYEWMTPAFGCEMPSLHFSKKGKKHEYQHGARCSFTASQVAGALCCGMKWEALYNIG